MWSAVQVVSVFGAGVLFGWGPAPQMWFLRATVAQVPPLFPHLRHRFVGPAPLPLGTCASGVKGARTGKREEGRGGDEGDMGENG